MSFADDLRDAFNRPAGSESPDVRETELMLAAPHKRPSLRLPTYRVNRIEGCTFAMVDKDGDMLIEVEIPDYTTTMSDERLAELSDIFECVVRMVSTTGRIRWPNGTFSIVA